MDMVPDLNTALSNIAVSIGLKAREYRSIANDPEALSHRLTTRDEALAMADYLDRHEAAARAGVALHEPQPSRGVDIFSAVPSYWNVFQCAVKEGRSVASWDEPAGPTGSATTGGMSERFKRVPPGP